MPKQLKDLQKLIEERASRRLLIDLEKLSDIIMEQQLLVIDDNMTKLAMAFTEDTGSTSATASQTKIAYKSKTFHELFHIYRRPNSPSDLSGYLLRLYNYHLPAYVEQESKELLERVDALKEDIDNILNNLPS